jgi:hypothetical protein
MQKPIVCAVFAALSGCCSMPQNEGQSASVSEVVERIKEDLAAYQEYDALASLEAPLKNACGGIIGFYVESVKVSLTTQTDDTVAGSAGFTLPVGSGTFGPSFGASQQTKDTQTLTFSLYPKQRDADPTMLNLEGFKALVQKAEPKAAKNPIAASLKGLREGLLAASGTKPCFSLVPLGSDGKPLAKDDGGSYLFGFSVSKMGNTKADIKFAVFSLGASGTSQRTAGNTITATFKARQGAAAMKAE